MITRIKIILVMILMLSAGVSEAQKVGRDREWSEEEIDKFLDESELIPIMINGDKDNRINIVLMNRWSARESAPYNSEEMKAEFLKDIDESIIAALTPGDPKAKTAYANYKKFFNIYGLWYADSPEWDKGINGKAADAMRDKLFLPWSDENLGWATFLVLPNAEAGGGGAARNLEARLGRALIAGNGIDKMLHEIAHTCLSIGDEYTGPATGTGANPTYTVSREYERDQIKWREWIEPDTPLPTPYTKEYKDKVGAFEGAQYHLVDYHRSTAQGCIMGSGVFDNTEEMCPICEQRLAMRVYKLVNPINSYTPSNREISIDGTTDLHFEVDHITPIPNTQVVRWFVNGNIVATGSDAVDIELGPLAEYTISCTITDETPLIKPDPPYAKYPVRDISWSVNNSKPESKLKDLTVELKSDTKKGKVVSKIKGGSAPYTYMWSNGDSREELINIKPGIYELTVSDSEYRTAKANIKVLDSELEHSDNTKVLDSGDLEIETKVTASAKYRKNGKIELTTKGGTPPYTVVWNNGTDRYSDGVVYEAEDAKIDVAGYTEKEYFDASNKKMIQFNNKEGAINWSVTVAKTGIYPIDIAYAGVARKGTPMDLLVNGAEVKKSILFEPTRPLFTGWEKATVKTELKEGENIITLKTIGKSGANIDYIRVPSSYTTVPSEDTKRYNLEPGKYSVVVTDSKNRSIEKTIDLPEVYPYTIDKLDIEINRPGVLSIAEPLEGYSYLWYADDVPLFTAEQFEDILAEGVEFRPTKPGRYYIAAKNNYSNVESSNRICISVGDRPESNTILEMDPSQAIGDNIELWFDASDLDGDGNSDGFIPERGPVKNWMEKTWNNPGKLFAKYEPNKLNNLGVCEFGNVWVSDLGKKISGIQTVILVYKESSLTFPGKCVFRGLNRYLGASEDPSKSIFDYDSVDKMTQQANVFLNGDKVDPFNTPNPMDYCILTVEFPELVNDQFERIEGFWEGDIAEMIFIDRALTETERVSIEEHLRKKWLATVDLEF